jgi:Sulfotransferase family
MQQLGRTDSIPSFLVIGATKCGTESLHAYLSGHPEVFIHPKELRYFTREFNLERGADWYREQFSAAGSALAIGEGSNAYTRDPVYGGAAARIHRALPNVRLIYVIRHPIDRIRSHYRHRLVQGTEWRSPEAALREDPAYLAASCYGRQLELYRRHFPAEQILTLRLPDLVSRPEPTLARLCRFLGISETPGTAFPSINVTADRIITPQLLRNLSRFPAAKPYVLRASRRLRRAGLGGAVPAGETPFELSRRTREDLAATFGKDRELLSRLVGESFDEWDLDAG